MKKIFVKNDIKNFWDKKTIVSYILSIFVLMIHISSIANYDNTAGDLLSSTNLMFDLFVKNLFTNVAVPLFLILSGFAFFRNYNTGDYLKKLKSRTKTIIIPYLLWNTISMILTIIITNSFASKFLAEREKFDFSFINIFLGIFHFEYNGPFWFIFALIVYIIASPLIHISLKNKYVGIAIISSIIVLMPFIIKLPDNFLYRSYSIVFYLIGAYYGLHYKDLFIAKTTKLGKVIYSCIAVCCLILNAFIITGTIKIPVIGKEIFLIVFTLSTWRVMDIVTDIIKVKPFMTKSFMVYALHLKTQKFVTKILYLVFPKSDIFFIPNEILTIILTLVVINVICILLQKISPKLYSLLSGSR